MDKNRTILVTGATGHVGSRLLRRLEVARVPVRALARRRETLAGATAPTTEVVEGDVRDPDAMHRALAGIDTAFFLVHALAGSGSFGAEERRGARVFATAARERGVRRLVYLGGIAHGDGLSEHLASRVEVGEILRSGGVETIELRASIVVGRGSASFELVRTLVDRLPALVAPHWLDNGAQPIAVDDLVDYLVAAVDVPVGGDGIYEIGGADAGTYRDLVDEVAHQTGRRPVVGAVPLPPPLLPTSALPRVVADRLPESARVAAKLLESLRFDTTVHDHRALREFPVRPRGLADAVAAALAEE